MGRIFSYYSNADILDEIKIEMVIFEQVFLIKIYMKIGIILRLSMH